VSGRDDEAGEGVPDTGGTRRIDKWLWFTRALKSRTLAARLVEEGRVRVNREKVVKPSHAVRAGDVITASINGHLRVLKVVGLGERRGPPSEAQTLYEDLTPLPDPAAPAGPLIAARDPGTGRPTKRERREIDRLTRPEEE
jgi:ribosome-associated heat shock protein Hsp15